MTTYQFTSKAKADLRDIAAYISKDSPTAAVRVINRLREVCRTTLVMFPRGGTSREDLAPGLRCFSVGNYVIYFRGQKPVEIVRILHGARDVSPQVFDNVWRLGGPRARRNHPIRRSRLRTQSSGRTAAYTTTSRTVFLREQR